MDKINWTKEELESFKVKNYILCENCGYLVLNPLEKDKECPNCGNVYSTN